jgi:hypothetical protein
MTEQKSKHKTHNHTEPYHLFSPGKHGLFSKCH